MRILMPLLALSVIPLPPRNSHAHESLRCSMVRVATFRTTEKTFLVGSALPDTLLAIPPRSLWDFSAWVSRQEERPAYGQVIRVDQVGGSGTELLEKAFRRAGVREIIVVPWSYDSSCRPVPWAGSARWVTTSAPGFFRLQLRAESQWTKGRPVLDAYAADLEPYPHGTFFQAGFRGTDALKRGPSLTPAQYFELYAALPDPREAASNPARVAAILNEWVRAHPDLAVIYPASEILRYARRAIGADDRLE